MSSPFVLAPAFTPIPAPPSVLTQPNYLMDLTGLLGRRLHLIAGTQMYQSGTRGSPGTPATTGGQTVALWLDQSGRNNDFAISANAPVVDSAAVNGILGVLFNGSSQFLALANGGDLDTIASSSVFIVGRYDAAGNSGFNTLLSKCAASGNQIRWYMFNNTGKVERFNGLTGNHAIANGTVFIFTYTLKNQAASTAEWIRFQTFLEATTVNVTLPAADSTNAWNLGAAGGTTAGTGANHWHKGNILEVIVLDHAADEPLRAKIETALINKYAITTTTDLICCEANSLSAGTNSDNAGGGNYGAQCYPAQMQPLLTATATTRVYNAGIPGQDMSQVIAKDGGNNTYPSTGSTTPTGNGQLYSGSCDLVFAPAARRKMIVSWELTNDIVQLSLSTTQAMANQRQHAAYLRGIGWDFIVGASMIPRNQYPQTALEAKRVAVNSGLESEFFATSTATYAGGGLYLANSPWADAWINWELDPNIGVYGCNTVSQKADAATYFSQTDYTHLTGTGVANGYLTAANWVKLVADAFSGSPVAPTGLSRNYRTGDGQIGISWTAVLGAVSYTVYRDSVAIATTRNPFYRDVVSDQAAHSYTVASNWAGFAASSQSVALVC